MASSARWTGLLVALLGAAAAATHFGLLPPMNDALLRLAAQPSVRNMFRDPITGSSDAFVALLAFAIAIPVALFLAVLLLIVVGRLVAGFVKPVLRAVKLPEAGAATLVSIGFLGGIVATREAWLPYCTYALASAARAYVVWAGSRPPLVQ